MNLCHFQIGMDNDMEIWNIANRKFNKSSVVYATKPTLIGYIIWVIQSLASF